MRSIKRKIRLEEEHKVNSPWNIASLFRIDLIFSINDITGMLQDYETDHLTGMDIAKISSLLYDYTSGYLYLVSRICKIMGEELISDPEFAGQTSVWTKNGFLKAVRQLLQERSPLIQNSDIFAEGSRLREQFIKNGRSGNSSGGQSSC